MNKFRVFALLLVVMSVFANGVLAQDEPPVLHLLPEDMGKTFQISTGTVIEVNLFFSELHVSYDPTKIQFLDYTLPEGLTTGTVESGVIEPEGVTPDTLPTPMPSETQSTEGSATASVGTISGGVVTIGGDDTNIEESYTTWRFLAIGSGETSLELLTFYPPCPKDQPCPMMPDFLAHFDLVIEGDAVVVEPESIEGEVIVVEPQPTEPTINVKSGEVVLFDVSEIEPPFRVIHHPGAVRLLPGEDLRFLVNPWGMTTRVGIRTSNDEWFAVTLVIEAECDSCGVLPTSTPGR